MSIFDALSKFARKQITLPSVAGGPGSRHGKGAWRFVTRHTGQKEWAFVYGATPQQAYASPIDNTNRAVVGVAPEGPSATALAVGDQTESHYGVDTDHDDAGGVTIHGRVARRSFVPEAFGAGDVEGMARKNFEHVAENATLDSEEETEEDDSTVKNEDGTITYPHALQMVALDIIVQRLIANIEAPERASYNGGQFNTELTRDGAYLPDISEEDRQAAVERGEVYGNPLRGWSDGENAEGNVSEKNQQFIGADHEYNVNNEKGMLRKIIKDLSALAQSKDSLTKEQFDSGLINKKFRHASFDEILEVIEEFLPTSVKDHLSKSQQKTLIAENQDLFDEYGKVKEGKDSEWIRICKQAILMDALETANAFAVSCKEKGVQIIPLTSPDLPSSISGYASEEHSRTEEARNIPGGGSLVFYFKGDRSLLKGDIVSAWGDSVPTLTEKDHKEIDSFLKGKLNDEGEPLEVSSKLEKKVNTIFGRLSMTQYKDFKFDARVLDGTIDMGVVLDEIEQETEKYKQRIEKQAQDIAESGKVFAVTDQAVISDDSMINPDSIIAESYGMKAVIIPSRASEYFPAKSTVVSIAEARATTQRKKAAINAANSYRDDFSVKDPSNEAAAQAAALVLPSPIADATGNPLPYQTVVDSFPKLKSAEKLAVFRDLEMQGMSNGGGEGSRSILSKIKASLLPVDAALYAIRSSEQAKAIEKIKQDFYLAAMDKILPRGRDARFNIIESSESYLQRIDHEIATRPITGKPEKSFKKTALDAKKSSEDLSASYFVSEFSKNNDKIWNEIELATMRGGSATLYQLGIRQKDFIAKNPKLQSESDIDYAKRISTDFYADENIFQNISDDLGWDKSQKQLAKAYHEKTDLDPSAGGGSLVDMMCAAGTRNRRDDVEWLGLVQKAVTSQLAGIFASKSLRDKRRANQIVQTINDFSTNNPNLNIPLISGALTDPKSIQAYQMYCDANDIKIIHFDSPEYPAALRQLGADAPAIIYAKGNLGLLGTKSVACVGTAQFDDNIINPVRNHIYNTIRHLSQTGYTIVSGLANGVDYVSHQAALKHGAPTIAVVAGGVDGGDWGKGRRGQLYDEILAKNGLIISESPIGINNNNKNMGDLLVQRNRIQAGLSAGTIAFLSAESKSHGGDTGTMHTVKDTVHYGRFLATVNADDINIGPSIQQQDLVAGNRAIVYKHGGFAIRPSDYASLKELSNNLDESHKTILQKAMDSRGVSSTDVYADVGYGGMSDENRAKQHAVSWEDIHGTGEGKAVLSPFPPAITQSHLIESSKDFGSSTPKSMSDIDMKAVRKQWKNADSRRRFGRYEGDTIKQKLSKAAIDFGTSINSPAMQKLRIMAGRTKAKIIVLDRSKSGSKLIGGNHAPKMSWSFTGKRGAEERAYASYDKVDHDAELEPFNWGNNVTVNPADSGVAALGSGQSFLPGEGQEYHAMDAVRAGKIKKTTSSNHSIAKFSIQGTPLAVRVIKRTYTAHQGAASRPATVSHIELFLNGNLVAQYRKGSVFSHRGSDWAKAYGEHIASIDDSNINYGLSMAAEYIARRQNAFSQAKINKTKQGSGLSETGMENPHIFPGNSPLKEDITQSGSPQSGEHTNFEIEKESVQTPSTSSGRVYDAPSFRNNNYIPAINLLNSLVSVDPKASVNPPVAFLGHNLDAHMMPDDKLPLSLKTRMGGTMTAEAIAKNIGNTLNLASSTGGARKWLQNLQRKGTKLAFVPSSVWQYKSLPTRLLDMGQKNNINKDAAAITASTNEHVAGTFFALGASIDSNGAAGQDYLTAKKELESASTTHPGADWQLTKQDGQDKHLIIIGSNALHNPDAVLLQLGNAANAVFGDSYQGTLIPLSESTSIKRAIAKFSSAHKPEYDAIIDASRFGPLDDKQKSALLFSKLYMREIVRKANPSAQLPFPEVTAAEQSLGSTYQDLVGIISSLSVTHATQPFNEARPSRRVGGLDMIPTHSSGLEPAPRSRDTRIRPDSAKHDAEGLASAAREQWKQTNPVKIAPPNGIPLEVGTRPGNLAEIKKLSLTKNMEMDATVHYNMGETATSIIGEISARGKRDDSGSYTYQYPQMESLLKKLLIYPPQGSSNKSTVGIDPASSADDKSAWRAVLHWSINNRVATDVNIEALTPDEKRTLRTQQVEKYYENLGFSGQKNDTYSQLCQMFDISIGHKEIKTPEEYAESFKDFLSTISVTQNKNGSARPIEQQQKIQEVIDSVDAACGKLKI